MGRSKSTQGTLKGGKGASAQHCRRRQANGEPSGVRPKNFLTEVR